MPDNFYIKEIDNCTEKDFRDLEKFWNEFEKKYSSQNSESVLLLKSLVKLAFTQGYSYGKTRQRPSS